MRDPRGYRPGKVEYPEYDEVYDQPEVNYPVSTRRCQWGVTENIGAERCITLLSMYTKGNLCQVHQREANIAEKTTLRGAKYAENAAASGDFQDPFVERLQAQQSSRTARQWA